MENLLSDKALKLKESETIKMSQRARDLRNQGHDVINLSLGEPDFDTPDYIKEAAKLALDQGYTKYTPVPGLVELRDVISKKFREENGLDYAPDQIVVSNGAKQSLANIAQAVLNPGDEVIIFAPYWVSYRAIVNMAGGIPIFINTTIDDDYKVSAEQLEEHITSKTKFVLFSSPCNPTGSVYSKSELEAMVEVLKKHPNILVVADEIYEYINFTETHHSIGSFEGMIDRTATINGFSKGFSMTGWRLGYVGAPKWLAKACTKIQGQFTSGASAFGQKAAADILLMDKTKCLEMKAAFRQRRELVINLLNKIPLVRVNKPQGAFYIFPDFSGVFGMKFNGHIIGNSVDLCNYLLNEAHVALVPGSAFGLDQCIRISYAASTEEITEALRRITKAIEQLK